jgi:peptidoglycan/LPS O-acetylase OafA/YrhL
METKPERLPSLTGLRFFAAALVVMTHTVFNEFEPSWNRLPHLSAFAGLGYTGVTFFYVLSGFVLTWTWSPGLHKRTFYGRRFARIYPLHVLGTVAAVLVFQHLYGRTFDVLHVGAALALIQAFIPKQSWFFAANGPSWSLSCEAFFYATLPLFLPALLRQSPAKLRRLAWLCGGLFAAATGLGFLLHAGNAPLLALWVFPPFRILEFVIGVVLALAVKRGWRSRLSLPGAVAGTLIGYLLVSQVVNHVVARSDGQRGGARLLGDVLVLPLVVVLIGAAATADLGGRRGLLATSPLVRLGDWSFALYLFHDMLALELRNSLGDAHSTVGALAREALVVTLAVALAGVLHELVEHPLEKRIRRRVEAPDAAVAGVTAA